MPETFLITNEVGRQSAMSELAGLDLGGKKWEVIVKRHRKRRSNAQNNLYHAWVDEAIASLSDFTGYEKFEVKKLFKDSFLEPGRDIQIKGLSTLAEPTTTTLDTGEMAAYMDKIYRWVTSEFGFALRLPPERGYDRDGRPMAPEQVDQANGQADDWLAVVQDIEAGIKLADNGDRLLEIDALYEAELTAMEKDAPAHYTRVMRAMENRGQELDHPDFSPQDPALTPVGAG